MSKAVEDGFDIAAAERALQESGGFAYPAEVVDMMLDGLTPAAAWRSYRGLSQNELARRSGVSQPGILRLETKRGDHVPKAREETRRKLAAVLDIPAWALEPLD